MVDNYREIIGRAQAMKREFDEILKPKPAADDKKIRADCDLILAWETLMGGFDSPNHEAILAFILQRHKRTDRPMWADEWVAGDSK